jgi:hypothetical protein
MGCKPWLKVGTLLLGGVLLCGCQDPPLRNSGLSRTPDPNLGKSTTGTGTASTGAGMAPGNGQPNAWGSPGADFNNTRNANTPPGPATLNNTSGFGATGPGAGNLGSSSLSANSPAGVNSQIQPPTNTLSGPAPLGAKTSDWAVGNGGAGNPIPPVGGPIPPPVQQNGFNNPSTQAPFTPPGQPGH